MGSPSPHPSNEAADVTAPPALNACSDDVLDSILARILQSVDGSDAGGSVRWRFLAEPVRRALRQLDRRKKLEMLFTLDALWQDLLTALPQEVQALADCGFFRMLCLNLHDANPVAFACVVEGLSHCIRILPELVLKAWEYGAVRPIAAFILDHKALAETQTLILDLRLQHALYFLASMGGPLTAPGCSEEAQKTSKKCFNWFLKQGVISRVAEIWVALPKAGVELERDGNYIVIVYRAAVTLMFASHFALLAKGLLCDWDRLTDCDEPVAPGVNDYRHLIVGVCTCLLLSNWLQVSTGPEPEVQERGKKEIAEHPDILTVLRILRRLVESPDPLIARNGKLSFVALVRLLMCDHPRPLPDGSVETAFRFLGDPSIKHCWGNWMFAMAQSFCAGTLTADFLAHFFPGFLHGFAAEAHRRKPARVYDPDL
ncbi:hypothetical protein KFL_002650100 [Klebsormidium nitens]|uniref:Uncharacterized protein n=1 Tax=Klebsormidium nitens TaxID=105231 RepID=A0A1Y1I4Y4_KLENI|nr:hypothetical protein KFL_002650100 [Klebsormidium nitens]|eukprot:GAQ86014.1 hypothetical protein KFL_002650100 [Klebsormidium nitens]